MVKMKRVWQFGAVGLASMMLLAGCSSKSNKEGQATASTGAVGLSVKSGTEIGNSLKFDFVVPPPQS